MPYLEILLLAKLDLAIALPRFHGWGDVRKIIRGLLLASHDGQLRQLLRLPSRVDIDKRTRYKFTIYIPSR